MVGGKAKPKDRLTINQARKMPAKTDPVKEVITSTGTGCRADLMHQAKERGIKYFRILNKAELKKILALTLDEDRNIADDIIAEARARWKAGWGKRKGAANEVTA